MACKHGSLSHFDGDESGAGGHEDEEDGDDVDDPSPFARVDEHFVASIEYGCPRRSRHRTTVILSQPSPPI